MCVCVRAHTTVMNTGYFCFCLVAFLIPLCSCKHKYLSTKRYKGVDSQLLIMNQTSASSTETSISGVKGHSWMITWSHHHCQEKQLCPPLAHCCSVWLLHQPLFWSGAIACAATWWVTLGNRSTWKLTLPFLPSVVLKKNTHQSTLSKFELKVEERSGLLPSKTGAICKTLASYWYEI